VPFCKMQHGVTGNVISDFLAVVYQERKRRFASENCAMKARLSIMRAILLACDIQDAFCRTRERKCMNARMLLFALLISRFPTTRSRHRNDLFVL